eukprot:3539460-Rhodomonas_salina.2
MRRRIAGMLPLSTELSSVLEYKARKSCARIQLVRTRRPALTSQETESEVQEHRGRRRGEGGGGKGDCGGRREGRREQEGQKKEEGGRKRGRGEDEGGNVRMASG